MARAEEYRIAELRGRAAAYETAARLRSARRAEELAATALRPEVAAAASATAARLRSAVPLAELAAASAAHEAEELAAEEADALASAIVEPDAFGGRTAAELFGAKRAPRSLSAAATPAELREGYDAPAAGPVYLFREPFGARVACREELARALAMKPAPRASESREAARLSALYGPAALAAAAARVAELAQ